MSLDTKVICLTPVRNEEWIIETFLSSASVWADHIVVADQMSTDRTREICARFPKVILLNNDSPTFNEPERQKLLIDAARRIPCQRRILVALDADEILAGDFSSREWNTILHELPPGQVLEFDWLNVMPPGVRYWAASSPMPFGYVDDGRPHDGSRRIHSVRIPYGDASPRLRLGSHQVLHLQYIDWERMRSKHRWYECFERLNFPEKSPVEIYRMYHHMYRRRPTCALDPAILSCYAAKGIDPLRFSRPDRYHWDSELVELVERHGASAFRHCDIWDVGTGAGEWFRSWAGSTDPRTAIDKAIQKYLRTTQPSHPAIWVRAMDKLLRLAGYGRNQ